MSRAQGSEGLFASGVREKDAIDCELLLVKDGLVFTNYLAAASKACRPFQNQAEKAEKLAPTIPPMISPISIL